VAVDIVTMPKATTVEGTMCDAAVVVVDRFSGWIDAWPVLKKGLVAKKMGQLFAERWLEVMGIPKEIISDGGPPFTSAWWSTFCNLRGVRPSVTIAYRPQSNGAAERAVKSVLQGVRRLQVESGTSWVDALPRALRLLRTTPRQHGLSPYELLFGRDPFVLEVCYRANAFVEKRSTFIEDSWRWTRPSRRPWPRTRNGECEKLKGGLWFFMPTSTRGCYDIVTGVTTAR
jgi:hypothetical protein